MPMDLLLLCSSGFSVSLWLSLNAYQAQLREHRRGMREHFMRLQAAEQGRRTDDDADADADDHDDDAEAAAAADAAADVPFARGHTSSAPLRSAALRSAPVHAFDPALASRGSGSGSGSGTDESAQV